MTTEELVQELMDAQDSLTHASEHALRHTILDRARVRRNAARDAVTARIAALEAVLARLIETTDDGFWHSSGDCRVEGYADDCKLCAALDAAREVLET